VPSPPPVVLVVAPIPRLAPLLAGHPDLAGVHLLADTGAPGEALAAQVLEAVRTHDPAAIVLALVAPHAALWRLLVRLRRRDPAGVRPVILTTDRPATAGDTGVGMLLQAAIVVGVGGQGLLQLVSALQDALQRRGGRRSAAGPGAEPAEG
jgi:hypothetical protein